jgi:hypothetical protein
MKPQINKVEFVFETFNTLITVRWQFLGFKEVQCMNCKHWLVSAIVYNDGSGILNKIQETEYTTTLQPNLTNSNDYLLKILNK